MYGMQPKHARQQRARAQALGQISPQLFLCNITGKRGLLCGVSSLVRNVGHGPLATRRAVGRRRGSVQICKRSRCLVHGTGLLLRRHSGLGLLSFGVCSRSDVTLLRVGLRGRRGVTLLRRWRASIRLLSWLLVHLALLKLRRCVRVLVDRRLLMRNIGGLRELVHRDLMQMLVEDRQR